MKPTNTGMSTLTDTQQAFVRRYMDQPGVLGVRVREIEGETVLLVEVCKPTSVALPDTFRGLPVRVHEGRPAVLAYS
jgi:hypothetical protein